ncbi:MAG: cyclic nucleotide-binding domain-containing protein [Acidimicrobiia bacterium]
MARKRHRVSFEEQLASVPLLAALSSVQLQAMAHRATRAHEPTGMIFSKEGERGDELVVILEGEVQVRHDDEVLATLGPGEFVGEMALLDDASRRTATVVARTPVVVAYIGRHDFDVLLEDSPEVAAMIHETIATRARGDEERPPEQTA